MLITKFYRQFIAGLAVVFLAAVPAAAQSKVLVVDTQRVLAESEVGKHVQRQIESIRKTMASEITAVTSPAKNSQAALQAELKGKSQAELIETLKARPDLQKKLNEVQASQQNATREAKIKEYELGQTGQKALNQVSAKIGEIIVSIAKERSADVVLDRSSVIYGAPVDITDVVLSRLNTQMTRVSVVRERLPRNPAPKK